MARIGSKKRARQHSQSGKGRDWSPVKSERVPNFPKARTTIQYAESAGPAKPQRKSGWEKMKAAASKVKSKMEERRAFNESPAGKKAAKERAARAKRMMAALNAYGSSGGGGGSRKRKPKKKARKSSRKKAYKTVTYYG